MTCAAAGDARFERDPARIAAHDFDHHHAMVGLGRGVNLVDGVGSGVQRGIKAESNFGGGKIIVDGLGHAHDLHALLEELLRNGLGPVAADADHGVHSQLAGVGNHLVGNIPNYLDTVLDTFVVERIAAVGGAQDSAPAGQNAAHVFEREFAGPFRPNQPVEAIGNADDLPLVLEDGGLHRGADDRIKAGGVATSGTDADAADVRHRSGVSYGAAVTVIVALP